MKNKKGFTLAELLGVLAILAVITVITVPLVNNYIKSSKEKAYDAQIKTIENAAKEWFVVNSTSAEFENDTYFLKINDLKQSEYLSSDDIINPKTNEIIEGCVKILNDEGRYTYEYSKTCSFPIKFTYTGAIQTYNVPSSGEYNITLVGAAGNIGNNYYNNVGYMGGKGASLSFDVSLAAGDILYLIVGGMGNTTTGTSSNGASGAGGGGSFAFRKINAVTNSKYQFYKGSDKYEVLGVAAGGNGTCDISYNSCSGNDGIANPYYSLSNYKTYSTSSTTGSTSGVLGIQQFINYNFQISTYTKNSSICTGGYGGGGCQNNSQGYGGGWALYDSSAGSFTIGTNVEGKNGINNSNGYIEIIKMG